MSFDPLAYAQSQSSQQAQPFDPLAYARANAQAPVNAPKEHPANSGKDGIAPQLYALGSGLYHQIKGGYKGIATLASGGGLDAAANAVRNEEAQAYQAPKADMSAVPVGARQSMENANTLMPNPLGGMLGGEAERLGFGPGVSTLANTLGSAAPFLAGFKNAPEAAAPLEDILSKSLSKQSMGAAAAAPPISALPADLKQSIFDAAQKNNGVVPNVDALQAHIEAAPHGIQLTKGQATQDPIQFSAEQNSTNKAIVSRLNAQNEQMVNAIDNIRQEASPTTVHNNQIDNGQTAVDSLKAYDEPIVKDINAKYEAARAASANGDLQMDGSSFVQNANEALKAQSKFRFLPPAVKSILDDVESANGKMTLDDYQAYDTQLGNEVAKANRSGDGNAAFAIGQVKSALNAVQPMGEETAQAKALFDTARAAAKARFDALDSDPAYRSAVDDAKNGVKIGEPSPLADNFLNKYVLGTAPKANVDAMVSKLDPEARGAVTSHALNFIKKAAVNPNGNVLPNGYNGAMLKLEPKMDSLLPSDVIDKLQSLGRTITRAKVAPAGNFVNYSKSGVITNAAQGLGEAAINAKTFGLGVPIIRGMQENAFAKDALLPGAGIDQ